MTSSCWFTIRIFKTSDTGCGAKGYASAAPCLTSNFFGYRFIDDCQKLICTGCDATTKNLEYTLWRSGFYCVLEACRCQLRKVRRWMVLYATCDARPSVPSTMTGRIAATAQLSATAPAGGLGLLPSFTAAFRGTGSSLWIVRMPLQRHYSVAVLIQMSGTSEATPEEQSCYRCLVFLGDLGRLRCKQVGFCAD